MRELRIYTTAAGRAPYREWLLSLKDSQTRAIIRIRLARVQLGNLGDCRPAGQGLSELRIHHGPGYRVYFGQDGPRLVLLLCGGSKGTQGQDIVRAKSYWRDYRSRRDAENYFL